MGTVAQGLLSAGRLKAMDESKSQKHKRVFNLPIPTSCCGGILRGWLACRPWVPRCMLSFSIVTFMTTESTLNAVRSTLHRNSDSFLETEILAQNVRSAINFQWYFSLPLIFMEFLQPPHNTSGPGRKYMLSATVEKHISFFFSFFPSVSAEFRFTNFMQKTTDSSSLFALQWLYYLFIYWRILY